MWGTFWTVVSLVGTITFVNVLGWSWYWVLFFFAIYMMLLPPKLDSVRPVLFFLVWMREWQNKLSFAGRVDLLKDKKPRLFAFSPHGVHCAGSVLFSDHPDTTHIRIACTSVLFWIPIVKDIVAIGGAFPCYEKNMKEQLRAGYGVGIYPGGLNEVPYAHYLREPEYQAGGDDPSTYTYNRRKGFVRIAMEEGVDIVPVWVEGETALYDVYHPFPRMHAWLYRKTGYPWPLVSWGWKWMPWMTKHHPVVIHIGEPISTRTVSGSVRKFSDSTRKEQAVDELHQQYLQGLQRLKPTTSKQQ